MNLTFQLNFDFQLFCFALFAAYRNARNVAEGPPNNFV